MSTVGIVHQDVLCTTQLLVDTDLIYLHKHVKPGEALIDPFVDHQVREIKGVKVASWGLSSVGYDIRLGTHFKMARPAARLDIKNPNEDDWFSFICSQPFWLRPNDIVLGMSIESFCMPEDGMAVCLGKSKYARVGIFPSVTPLEPGWVGSLTIEVANLTRNEVCIYPGEGIAQLLFYRLHRRPLVTYEDREGVFQGQTDVTLGRV